MSTQVGGTYIYSCEGNTWNPSPELCSLFLLDSPCHPSPPLCLHLSSFSCSSILSRAPSCRWAAGGSASPSLANTHPLGNASTLVPGSFSVNTSLLVVCASHLFTSVYLFRYFKASAFTVQRSRKISGVQAGRGAPAVRLKPCFQTSPTQWVAVVFVSRACYTWLSRLVTLETSEMFSERFKWVGGCYRSSGY